MQKSTLFTIFSASFLAACSPSICEYETVLNSMLTGANAMTFDNVQGYMAVAGIDASITSIDEVKSDSDRTVCEAKFQAKGNISDLADVAKKIAKDAGTDWITDDGKRAISEFEMNFKQLATLVDENESTGERVATFLKSKIITATSAITYAVNPNTEKPVLLGWQHSSADQYFVVSYAKQALEITQEGIAEELKTQGYDSLEQKQNLERAARTQANQFNRASKAVSEANLKLTQLEANAVEKRKLLAQLTEERDQLLPKTADVLEKALSNVVVSSNTDFTFSDFKFKKQNQFLGKELILEGKVKNKTDKYIQKVEFDGWLFPSGKADRTPIRFSMLTKEPIAPSATVSFYGTTVASDSRFNAARGGIISAEIVNAPRVGAWLRPISFDTDKERNLRTSEIGTDIFRSFTIDGEINQISVALNKLQTEMSDLQESMKVEQDNIKRLSQELSITTANLPKSSELYKQFLSANN